MLISLKEFLFFFLPVPLPLHKAIYHREATIPFMVVLWDVSTCKMYFDNLTDVNFNNESTFFAEIFAEK